MNNQKNKILNTVAKLMNEQEAEYSGLRKSFDLLFSYVEENLALTLDKGAYIDNASIIRKVNEILTQKEIFSIIPELAEKTIIAIWGQSDCIAKEFNKITEKRLEIGLNTNLPLLILPMKEEIEDKLYAFTYMDKLIPLSFEEYKCITRQIYKENIDIRKLIKGFVLYYHGENYKQSYLVLPEYVETNNSFYHILKNMIDIQILIADEDKKWQKQVFKIPLQKLYLFGTQEDCDYITGEREIPVTLCKKEMFKELCDRKNIPCINYSICIELQNTFMDIDVFYIKKMLECDEKLNHLADDSLKLHGEVKEQTQQCRTTIASLREKFNNGYNSFCKLTDEIMALAVAYENGTSTMLVHELADDVNADRYTENLLRVFNKHIYSGLYKEAEDDIVRLSRVNYKYSYACKYWLKYNKGIELEKSDIIRLKKYPDSDSEIAKIKVDLSKELELLTTDLKEIIKNVSPIETGKEYYYLGKRMLDEKNYIGAAENFKNALYLDYDKAGGELIKLIDKHPECNIKIEELAENLVADANYRIGKEDIEATKYSPKYKSGVVNLKMASAKKHIGAVEMVADILYKRCQRISNKEIIKEEDEHVIKNVISLYEYLEKKDSKEQYRLRIGLMYYKLRQYHRALVKLKDIDNPDAQYACSKMYLYGDGVAENLENAEEYCEAMPDDDKRKQPLYDKICKKIEKEEWNDENYIDNGDYSTSYSDCSSHSSYCFITTAACLALNESSDCDQLNELRRFRDLHILGDGEDGDELVEEYYRIGPTIVKFIDSDVNPRAIYNKLWSEYILPSCKMIKECKYESAKKIYIDMVKNLCEKYGVPVKESIMKKYAIDIKK